MMLPKVEEEQSTLLKDAETVSKTLYLEKSPSGNSTPSKSTDKDPKSKPNKEDNSRKDKKSIWNWKPFKALSLTRNKKFRCIFSLQVHLIEGLPLSFNDSSLCVHWKRSDEHLVTRPAKVIQGAAEFQDILSHTCSILGSRSGPHNSAKYEAKHFLLYVSMLGAPEMNLGKHRLDITRLLPLALEDLEEEKSSGKWTTSFRLSGKAKGAVMNVSFGYVVVGDNTSATRDNLCFTPNVLTSRPNCSAFRETDVNPCSIRRTESLPSFASNYSSQNIDEVKDLHEVLPLSKSARASSIVILYNKFGDENTYSPLHNRPDLDVLKENLEPIKLDAYCSPGTEKGKPEECNEGKIGGPMHDKPESDVFRESLKTIELDGYPLSDPIKGNPCECKRNGFSVVDHGVEFSSNEHVKLEESIVKAIVDGHNHTVDSIPILDAAGTGVSFQDSVRHEILDDLSDSSKESTVVQEFSNIKDELCTKELLMQELESALNNVSELETVARSLDDVTEYKSRKSHILDDVTESIANEFLSMLGIDHSLTDLSSESEPESPREHLLRQFEKDVVSEGFSLFDFDMGYDDEEVGPYDAFSGSKQLKFFTDIKPPSLLHGLLEGHLIEHEDVRSKPKGHILEDLETEALMREWGLNEEAFQHSPPKAFASFGSPIPQLPEDLPRLPPLAEGLGPFLQTKGGGFLRSMNPSLFRNAKSGGNLIMQVSNPVVVPAEMGSGIMEIMQYLASVGIEKLSIQANKLMPLEDITGKTMKQISWEAVPSLDRQCHLQDDLATVQDFTCVQRSLKGTSFGQESDKFSLSSVGNHRDSRLFSLEDLAPLAMDKIEALSIEGLKIQSGMSEEDEPSNIIAQPFGDISGLQGKGVDIRRSFGLDGAAALQLLDIKESSDEVDRIMGLSLTLDEWMRLDSGDIDDDIDNISEHTCKLLAAHHANSFDIICGSSKGRKKQGKGHCRKCGLLGNNFTIALMVQLHDSLRNYEPVGTPMLALIQVERMVVPPKQKIYWAVSEVGSSIEEDEECEIRAKVEMKDNKEEISTKEKGSAQFRITEVHVAGLKNKPHKKKLWGTPSQQQSGSRWLIANGMGKSNKNPLMKSKDVSKFGAHVTIKVQPGDTLWSISSRIYGTGEKWKELVALNPHIRNPNIIIPNESIRMR